MRSSNETVRNIEALTPECLVRINDKELPLEAQLDLIAVSVVEDVNATSVFSLTLVSWDGAKMKVRWIDDAIFKEGNVVEVRMGYTDKLTSIFKGEITGLEPSFPNEGPPTLTVRGYDRRHRLMRKRKTLSFLNMKDSEIASQIATNASLTPNVDDTKVTHDYVLQHNQTDMEFLKQRAQRIGYEMGVNDRTLYFRPRQETGKEVFTLNREVELLEFYPRLSTVGQLEEVSVQGWDPKKKKEVVAHSQDDGGKTFVRATNSGPATTGKAFRNTTGGISTDTAIQSQEEADQVAKGWFKEMSLHYVVGDGLCIGRSELRSGTLIRIEGLGERFSGLYYVMSTEHRYKPSGGYRTAFSVRRDAT